MGALRDADSVFSEYWFSFQPTYNGTAECRWYRRILWLFGEVTD
ncbi:hypothetical protein NXG27_06785 [Megasphaera paucivorans]|nr:hypothetical protein [Megasphaera paucivorans]